MMKGFKKPCMKVTLANITSMRKGKRHGRIWLSTKEHAINGKRKVPKSVTSCCGIPSWHQEWKQYVKHAILVENTYSANLVYHASIVWKAWYSFAFLVVPKYSSYVWCACTSKLCVHLYYKKRLQCCEVLIAISCSTHNL